MIRPAVLALASALTLPAAAQPVTAPVLAPDTAAPGATYTGGVLIHGCPGEAMVLRVEFPPGAPAELQHKPGWRTEVVRRVSFGGTAGKPPPISGVTWRGRLAADQAETFPFTLTAPDKEGPLAFGIERVCQGAQAERWNDRPGAAGPAPVLTVKRP